MTQSFPLVMKKKDKKKKNNLTPLLKNCLLGTSRLLNLDMVLAKRGHFILLKK